MKILACFLVAVALLWADGPGVILSHYAKADFSLSTDPNASIWKVAGVFAESGRNGEHIPGHRTEIRSRWTDQNIYFLFICPYKELHLKPNPVQKEETNHLWNWDVAEVFVGTDFKNIRRYKEFEISPQAEWVDLDIDRDKENFAASGWKWNSGFEANARIDRKSRIWYGAMRIPLKQIDSRTPANGLEMRVNLYRCQGPQENRQYIAWQPTRSESFHEPEAFGRLRLTGK